MGHESKCTSASKAPTPNKQANMCYFLLLFSPGSFLLLPPLLFFNLWEKRSAETGPPLPSCLASLQVLSRLVHSQLCSLTLNMSSETQLLPLPLKSLLRTPGRAAHPSLCSKLVSTHHSTCSRFLHGPRRAGASTAATRKPEETPCAQKLSQCVLFFFLRQGLAIQLRLTLIFLPQPLKC
jgi:hypothetical protein